MKRISQLVQTILWTLLVLVHQAPQVGAQPSETAPQVMKPAWLYEERRIGHEGWTQLMDASLKGDVTTVEALLDSGTKVDEADEHGVTPLYAAALGGQVRTMVLLLNRGADVDVRAEGGRTPLTGATWKGHLTAMDLLLERSADVNGKREDGTTPLMQVATAGNLEAGKLLLSRGANVNAQNQDGATALILAAEAGKSDMLELLLNSGASTLPKMKKGAHALYFAAQNGHVEIVRQLLNKGMKAQEPGHEGVTAIHAAAAHGRDAVVRELLDGKVNVNEQVVPGVTPLLLAAQPGHVQVVKLLLDRGADPNVATKEKGQSPLEIASLNGHVEIVRMLIAKGAKVNSKNLADMTPLFQASMKGHKDVVRLLLAHGADPNIESLIGTPLQYASAGGDVSIVNLLIENGAKTKTKWRGLGFEDATTLVDAANAPGSKALEVFLGQGNSALITPPSLALALLEVARSGNVEKAKMLLEKGADPNARNVWMQTPLMLASEGGYAEAVAMLVTHGADLNAKDREERLSAVELALLSRDEKVNGYKEEDVEDLLNRYDEIVAYLVEAEKSRREREGIKPRLVFITSAESCSLSTLDPLSGSITPWATLTHCPDEMFVSDRPGAIILRTKNKLVVLSRGTTSTASKSVSLPVTDKRKGWKQLFQVAGQLGDGRLAVGYRDILPRKKLGPQWRWTLYAHTEGKWRSIEQKDCLTEAWCLQTPFSGRSTNVNLGDEDWLWHPYVRLNPFFLDEGEAEKDREGRFAQKPTTRQQPRGHHYRKFVIAGTEHTYYYDLSPGPIYQTGERRYQVSDVYLERSGMAPTPLSGNFSTAALEGKYLLWSDVHRRLLDMSTGLEPIQNLHMAAWTYWGK